jgi:hypothetical protein
MPSENGHSLQCPPLRLLARSEPRFRPVYICIIFPTLGLVFYPEDGGRNFFRKAGNDLSDYTTSRSNSSYHFLLVENKIKHINTVCVQSIKSQNIETCGKYSEKVKLSL